MEPKDTLSSCSDSDEQKMQKLQKQASRQKENCMNGFRALQINTAFLLRKDFLSLNSISEGAFERAFLQLFGKEASTFKGTFSQNMNKLKKQLTKEKLHVNDSKTDSTELKPSFEKFFNLELQKSLTFKTREDFKKYTRKKAQIFIDIMIRDLDFIKKYVIETILDETKIEKRVKEKLL
ncbi:hypothetical protein Tco_1191308 [Tanacetum coccineum]